MRNVTEKGDGSRTFHYLTYVPLIVMGNMTGKGPNGGVCLGLLAPLHRTRAPRGTQAAEGTGCRQGCAAADLGAHGAELVGAVPLPDDRVRDG